MKLLNKLRRILHTLSLGILFKPHQDLTICPKHGAMTSCAEVNDWSIADPNIDPNKAWDATYYCPKCLQEEL